MSDDKKMSDARRRILVTTVAAGGAAGAVTAWPFVSSMMPSERAKAAGAPVEVDIGGLAPGEKMTVEWRGKPVWIVRRTAEQVADLPKNDPQLADPQSQRKPDELTPEYARN